MSSYPRPELTETERERLERVYGDLQELANSEVPAVAAAARAAVAQVAAALSGQGLLYELYSKNWR